MVVLDFSYSDIVSSLLHRKHLDADWAECINSEEEPAFGEYPALSILLYSTSKAQSMMKETYSCVYHRNPIFVASCDDSSIMD